MKYLSPNEHDARSDMIEGAYWLEIMLLRAWHDAHRRWIRLNTREAGRDVQVLTACLARIRTLQA